MNIKRTWLCMKHAIEQVHTIGRLGEAKDIACAVVFLRSGDAAFIVGDPLPVDGAYLAR